MKRLLFFLLLVPLVAAACGGDPSPPTGDPVATPIPTAPAAARPTYSVQRGTVEETLEFTGRWLPRDQQDLAFEVAGTVRGVYVRRDDTIQAGDLLADYDTSDLEAQLASAQLDLDAALNRLESGADGSVQSVEDAQFALANSKLALESTQANAPWTSLEAARIGLEQAQNAYDDALRAYDDAISRADSPAAATDSAWQRLRDAEIGLRTAQNQYYSAAQSYNNHLISVEQQENAVLRDERALQKALTGAGVDPDLVRAVQAAQLALDQIRDKIAKSSLRAPFDGVVLEVAVQPGDNAEAFKTVITLALPDPKEVVANLVFNDTQQLSVGMTGVCHELNRPETAVQCAVRQIPLSSRDADQRVRVAAQLDGLALGQAVAITMPLQIRDDVLWLPPAAIRTYQNRTFVVIQTPDGQRVADVVLGLETDERVEIVGGLSEGDVVVGP